MHLRASVHRFAVAVLVTIPLLQPLLAGASPTKYHPIVNSQTATRAHETSGITSHYVRSPPTQLSNAAILASMTDEDLQILVHQFCVETIEALGSGPELERHRKAADTYNRSGPHSPEETGTALFQSRLSPEAFCLVMFPDVDQVFPKTAPGSAPPGDGGARPLAGP